MCLAKAYVRSSEQPAGTASTAEGGERLMMENVTRVEIDGDMLKLRSLFGDTEAVRGHIASIDFAESRLVVQGVEA